MVSKKFPPHAKIVHYWQIFNVYNWEQELFDWTFTTFEWIERKPCVMVLAKDKNDNFIILKEIQPNTDWYYWFIAWMIEEWETPLESAKRELFEETWYKFEKIEEVWIMDDSWDWAKMQSLRYMFYAEGWEKIGEQKLDAWEKIELNLVPKNEILDYIEKHFRDFDKRLIKKHYLDKLN